MIKVQLLYWAKHCTRTVVLSIKCWEQSLFAFIIRSSDVCCFIIFCQTYRMLEVLLQRSLPTFAIPRVRPIHSCSPHKLLTANPDNDLSCLRTFSRIQLTIWRPWLFSQLFHLVINRLILIQGLKDDERWLQSGFLGECFVCDPLHRYQPQHLCFWIYCMSPFIISSTPLQLILNCHHIKCFHEFPASCYGTAQQNIELDKKTVWMWDCNHTTE